MNIPIIGDNIPIIGQEKQNAQNDPRTELIMEMMAVVSHCSDVLKAISKDTKETLQRLDMPEHSLVHRLLKKIGDVAEETVTSDPVAGILLRMEAAMVSKFLRWLEKTTAENMTADEIATVQKAIKIAIEKTQLPGEQPQEERLIVTA